jgi:hypothetical protein
VFLSGVAPRGVLARGPRKSWLQASAPDDAQVIEKAPAPEEWSHASTEAFRERESAGPDRRAIPEGKLIEGCEGRQCDAPSWQTGGPAAGGPDQAFRPEASLGSSE